MENVVNSVCSGHFLQKNCWCGWPVIPVKFTTNIPATGRLIGVRETGVSRHHGGPIEGPPETPRTSQQYIIERIKGVPDLGTKGNGNIVFSV